MMEWKLKAKYAFIMLFPSLSTKKLSQYRKMSIDSGVGVGEQSSASSNASINKDTISIPSGVMTPKGDASSTTGLAQSQKSSAAALEKGVNDIRITENPISESPELARDANPVC